MRNNTVRENPSGAKSRTLLKLIPPKEGDSPSNIDSHLASLADLSAENHKNDISTASTSSTDNNSEKIIFEFLALSQGEDEIVELYYSATDQQKALKKRLRSIYPSSFKIKEVDVDLGHKLLEPIKLSPEEFKAKLKADQLYHNREYYIKNDLDEEFGEDLQSDQTGSNPTETHKQEESIKDSFGEDEPAVEAPDSSSDGTDTESRPAKQIDGPTDHSSHNRDNDKTWEHSQQIVIDDKPIKGVVKLNPPEDINDNEPLVALDGPTLTEDGKIYIRPDIKYCEPNAVRWYGYEETPKDWMTTLNTATESNHKCEDGPEQNNVNNAEPLETLLYNLKKAKHPIGYQVTFTAKDNWENQYRRHKENIKKGESGESWVKNRILGGTQTERDRGPDKNHRIELINNKRPTDTFNANIRCISLAPKRDFSDNQNNPATALSNQQTRISQTLQTITSLLDPLNGIYYRIEGEVTTKNKSLKHTTPTANEVVTNFFARNILLQEDLQNIITKFNPLNNSNKNPEIVVNGQELGEFIIIPYSDDINDHVFRSDSIRDKGINLLPRPRAKMHSQLVDGMSLGYAYDDYGLPENKPTCLPEDQLTNHWAMFGASGSGKTVNTISMLLSAHRDTDGSTILVDPKQGDMVENYCKAHYEEFGDLKDVMIFDVSDALPAISFFDIRPFLHQGIDRDDAIQTKVDQFHLIMSILDKNYDTSHVSKTILGALIKANFDEKYGSDSYTLEELYETAVKMHDSQTIPHVSHQPQVKRLLSNRLDQSKSEFEKTMEAVINRINHLQEDINLYRLLNQSFEWDDGAGQYLNNKHNITDYDEDDPNDWPSEPLRNALDPQLLLDEEKIVLIDTGELSSDQSQHAISMYILAALWGAAKARHKHSPKKAIESTLKLVIRESAPILSTHFVTNTLIPECREFGVSLGLIMQYPDRASIEETRISLDKSLTNIQTKIYGQINPSREITDSMIHREKDVEIIKNTIRELPSREWIVDLPEPSPSADVPPPFSVRSLEIPDGHPDSENTLSASERHQIRKQAKLRKSNTRQYHGLTRLDPEQHGLLERVENANLSSSELAANDACDTGNNNSTGQPTTSDSPTAQDTTNSSNEKAAEPDKNRTGAKSCADQSGLTPESENVAPTDKDQSQQTTDADSDAEPNDYTGQSETSTVPDDDADPATEVGHSNNSTASSDDTSNGEYPDKANTTSSIESPSDSNTHGSGLYDDISPLPRSLIEKISAKYDFGELDQLRLAVSALEDKYDPVTQAEQYKRGIKRLAIEATAHGLDVTAADLATSANEGSDSRANEQTSISTIDPPVDSGGQTDNKSAVPSGENSGNTDPSKGDTTNADTTPTETGLPEIPESDVGTETDTDNTTPRRELAESLREAGIRENEIDEVVRAAKDEIGADNHTDSQPDDSTDQTYSNDSESEPDHPTDQPLDTPLRDRESFLTQQKREAIDLARDDLKFLALIADAFRGDLDGYTLTESMNDFDERAGHPDIEKLINDKYVKKMTVTRRTYYSLTRKAWRLINDGVPGNKFGDYMEKIKHRVGVYLLAEHLRALSVAKVEEYGRHNGETYDVIAYDSDGNVHTVGEVETSSNNKQAVIEDYEKLAEAPGQAVWAFPTNPVFEEVWETLEAESLVDEEGISDWKLELSSEMRKVLNDDPEPGMDSVFVYSPLRDSISESEQ